jgi:hypothetical protein
MSTVATTHTAGLTMTRRGQGTAENAQLRPTGGEAADRRRGPFTRSTVRGGA